MTTSTDPQSPTVPQDNRASYEEMTDSFVSNKYTQLEDLLRQTLTVAGEIAEAKKCTDKCSTAARPTSPSVPPFLSSCECIILRKGTVSDRASSPPPPPQQNYSSNQPSPPVVVTTTKYSTVGRKRPPSGDDSFDTDTSPVPSPSAASSLQEPFSPGTLALSLDAIVEEKRGDETTKINDNNDTLCLDSTSSMTSIGGNGSDPAASIAATAGRIPELLTMAAATTTTSPSQLSSPNTPQEYPPPPPSVYGLSSFRSLPGHHRKSSREGAGSEEQQQSTVLSSAPSRWHVRIIPISSPPTGSGSTNIGGNREAVGISPSTPSAAFPAYVKLEAVIPYRYAHDSSLGAAALSGEGSYIIIGRPPQDTNGGSGQMYLPGPLADCWHQLQTVREKSLQEYIDEWECPAGSTMMDDGCDAKQPVRS